MPSIPFGSSSYERARGDLPSLPVINGWIEESPTEPKGFVFQSRPGLTDRQMDMGAGPIRALFKGDNVLGSSLFGVSGIALYQDDLLLGSIDGSDAMSMAGYENFLFAAGGSRLWGYDGSSLGIIAFPDDADVAKVIVAQSRVVAIRKDTGKFYWSEPLEDTIDALAFATAEASPDRLKDMRFIDGILILGGAETIEFWPASTDADLPFSPLTARVIERGVKATGCLSEYGSTFAWVTDRNQVCLTDENTVISNPGLEERIAASTSCSLFRFFVYGMEFLGLRLDTEFQAWRAGRWSAFTSNGHDNFLPQCWSGDVFGSSIDGRTMAWGSDWTDLGGVLERRIRFGTPIDSGSLPVNRLELRCNVGQAAELSGTYAEPTINVRISRNAGRTFGPWKPTSLGRQGQYDKRVFWAGLGTAFYPALFGELRLTDPVDFRLSDVLLNEGR